MKAIIVDDEEKAREHLVQLLSIFCPQVNVVAIAENVSEGEKLLRQHDKKCCLVNRAAFLITC